MLHMRVEILLEIYPHPKLLPKEQGTYITFKTTNDCIFSIDEKELFAKRYKNHYLVKKCFNFVYIINCHINFLIECDIKLSERSK